MPTASGVVSAAKDKRASVDLVYRQSPTHYSLIELKVGSDNPLFAAIEILRYGLLFTWSKTHREQLGYKLETQPVLQATNITLCVLAPTSYYAAFDLTDFSSTLNSGIAAFGKSKGLSLTFEFSKLGSGYDSSINLDTVRRAVESREAV